MEKTSTHTDDRFVAVTPELKEKVAQILAKWKEVYGEACVPVATYLEKAFATEEYLPTFSAFTELIDNIVDATDKYGIDPAAVFGKIEKCFADLGHPRVSKTATNILIASSAIEIANMRYARVKDGGVSELLETLAKMSRNGEAKVEVVQHGEEETTTAPASTETH